jgi:hypothetical protein
VKKKERKKERRKDLTLAWPKPSLVIVLSLCFSPTYLLVELVSGGNGWTNYLDCE